MEKRSTMEKLFEQLFIRAFLQEYDLIQGKTDRVRIVDARWRKEISKRIEYNSVRVDTSFRASLRAEIDMLYLIRYIGFRNVKTSCREF